jgi:uncharacterized protein YggT (Ycf19 family)
MERRETEIKREDDEGTVQERHVTSGPPANPPAPPTVMDDSSQVVSSFNPARRGVELIYLVFGIIVGLLLIRMVLKVLAANPAAGFASFVYGATNYFLAPFRNLLPTVGNGQSQLEMSAVVAVLVYMLIAWALARFIVIIFSRNISVSRSRRSGLRPRGN